MPRPPRRAQQQRDTVTTTPTRTTATNAITAAIPPFMLETPPHAPFLTSPIPPSNNPGHSIVPNANIPRNRNARNQHQTPTANGNGPDQPPDHSQISTTALGSAISEGGHGDDHSLLESALHDPEDARQLIGLRDISSLATWTLSSSKPGCSLAQLRHPSPSYFWQSDGPQPHTLCLHFFKLVAIVKMRVYLDFELDESYTPTKMKFLAGMSEGGLVEFGEWEVQETTDPETGETHSGVEGIRGWIDVPLKGVGGRDVRYHERNEPLARKKGSKKNHATTGLLEKTGMSNLTPRTRGLAADSGVSRNDEEDLDTSTYTGGDVLRAMVVQVRICENHQNGKDTHVRGFQVFARDESGGHDVRRQTKKTKSGDPPTDEDQEETLEIEETGGRQVTGELALDEQNDESLLLDLAEFANCGEVYVIHLLGLQSSPPRSTVPEFLCPRLPHSMTPLRTPSIDSERMSLQRATPWVLTVGAICTCVILIYQQHFSTFRDPYKCRSLASSGSWSRRFDDLNELRNSSWSPSNCMMREYTSQEIEQCIGNGTLLFIGDSSARQIFWATAKKIDPKKGYNQSVTAAKHENISLRYGSVRLDFLWDPFLNLTSSNDALSSLAHKDLLDHSSAPDGTNIVWILIGSGLWHARHLATDYLEKFKSNTSRILEYMQSELRASKGRTLLPASPNQWLGQTIYFAPVLVPEQDKLDSARKATLTAERIHPLNDYLRVLESRGVLDVPWAFNLMALGQPAAYEESGLHVVDRVSSLQADILLNMQCSFGLQQHYPFDRTCCAPPPPINGVQASVLSLTLFVFVNLAFEFAYRSIRSRKHIQMTSEASQESYPAISRALAVFCAAILYSFIADRSIYFGKIDKVHDQKAFLILTGLVLVVGLTTLKRSQHMCTRLEKGNVRMAQAQGFLSREQTEEWKGWMQVVVLFYHYFGMSKVLWVYQLIRLMVSSYLFMTGFGHTVFFLKTNDFSLRRVTSVLARLNLLSCALAYVMRTDYDFYYFPALSSFWFLVVYITLRIGHSHRPSLRNICIRALISAATIKVVIHWPGLLEELSGVLLSICKMNVDAPELRFRVSLDLYITYVGMIFATFYLKGAGVSKCYWKENWPRLSRRRLPLQGGIIFVSLSLLVGYITLCHRFESKYDYNKWHPMISLLPVLAFVALRNSTHQLRSHHIRLYAWVGRCSLETFILQYHIWLAADTKGLLTLPLFTRPMPIPGRIFGDLARWTDFGIISIFFLWASWGVSRATNILSKSIAESTLLEMNMVGIRLFGLRTRIILVLGLLCALNWSWQP